MAELSKHGYDRATNLLLEAVTRQAQSPRAVYIPGQTPHIVEPLVVWTLKNRRLLKPDRPLDFTQHPFLIEIYNDTSRETVHMKAGQAGISEYLISYALHACDKRRMVVLYIFPTLSAVSDFATARIGLAIEASEYLARLISEGMMEGGRYRRTDKVTLKRVGSSFLYMRGGQVKEKGSAPQLRSVDADCVILDEMDEMDQAVVPMAEKRLGHSQVKEMRYVSTPSYRGFGVHKYWVESDQREWFVACPSCRHRQTMTIDNVVNEWDDLERPIHWNGGPDNAYILCEKCGKPLDRLAPGEWVARNPGALMTGYHSTKFFAPFADMLRIVRRLRKVDETERKECYNQDLGLPYTPQGGRLTEEHLDATRREYIHKLEVNEETTAGIDVGKVLSIVVRGAQHPETGEVPQRWAGVVESFEAALIELERWNVTRCVIDAMPEERSARKFQAACKPGRIWLAYYDQGEKRTEALVWNEEEGTVTIARTRHLDDMLSDVYTETRTLPANARNIVGYYSEMIAPVRVVEKSKTTGKPVARYVESSADHFFHAEGYELAARNAPRIVSYTASKSVSRKEMEDMFQ